jgi:hypothetical protein
MKKRPISRGLIPTAMNLTAPALARPAGRPPPAKGRLRAGAQVVVDVESELRHVR